MYLNHRSSWLLLLSLSFIVSCAKQRDAETSFNVSPETEGPTSSPEQTIETPTVAEEAINNLKLLPRSEQINILETKFAEYAALKSKLALLEEQLKTGKLKSDGTYEFKQANGIILALTGAAGFAEMLLDYQQVKLDYDVKSSELRKHNERLAVTARKTQTRAIHETQAAVELEARMQAREITRPELLKAEKRIQATYENALVRAHEASKEEAAKILAQAEVEAKAALADAQKKIDLTKLEARHNQTLDGIYSWNRGIDQLETELRLTQEQRDLRSIYRAAWDRYVQDLKHNLRTEIVARHSTTTMTGAQIDDQLKILDQYMPKLQAVLNLDWDQKTGVSPLKISHVRGLRKKTLTTLMGERELNLKTAQTSPVLQVIDEAVLGTLHDEQRMRDQLAKLLRDPKTNKTIEELASESLRAASGEGDAIRAQVAEFKSKYDAAKVDHDAAKAEYYAAKEYLAKAQATYDQSMAQARSASESAKNNKLLSLARALQDEKAIQLQKAQMHAVSEFRAYKEAIVQVKSNRIVDAGRAAYNKIMSRAKPIHGFNIPNRIAVKGIGFGFVAGFGFVLLADAADLEAKLVMTEDQKTLTQGQVLESQSQLEVLEAALKEVCDALEIDIQSIIDNGIPPELLAELATAEAQT